MKCTWRLIQITRLRPANNNSILQFRFEIGHIYRHIVSPSCRSLSHFGIYQSISHYWTTGRGPIISSKHTLPLLSWYNSPDFFPTKEGGGKTRSGGVHAHGWCSVRMLAEYNAVSSVLCCIAFCQQGESGFQSIIITSLVHPFWSYNSVI